MTAQPTMRANPFAEAYAEFITLFANVLFAVSLFAVWGVLTLIGVIVAEMYASVQGVGSLLGTYSHAMRINELFVVVAFIGVFGFLIVQAVRVLEVRASAWRQ